MTFTCFCALRVEETLRNETYQNEGRDTMLHIHITTSPSNPIFFIYNATAPSGCNTRSSAPMGEKTPNKSIFLERLIPAVVCMDIQCGCMFGDQSDTMEARANQRRTSRSNFFLEVNRGHLGNKSAPTIFQVAVGPRKRWRSDRPPLPSPLSH